MSGKKQFVALFDAMAERLLEQIDERNEEFLEQFRSIQDVLEPPMKFQSEDEASRSDTSLPPAVAPWVGISESAHGLFNKIPDEKRRMEFMWRYSQMEYARAAGDWVQWGAYLTMLVEGLCGDCLSRFPASRVGLRADVNQLELLSRVFENTKDGSLTGFADRIYAWGIHEGMGVLLPHEGTTFHKILSRSFEKNKFQANTLDEFGNKHRVVIDLDGMPRGFFSLDVVGLYLHRSFDLKEGIEVHRQDVQFLIGPLPHGRITGGGAWRFNTIKPPGGGMFKYLEAKNGGFPQQKYASIYYVNKSVVKNYTNWFINPSKQRESTRRFSELSLIDRILLAELLLKSWNEEGSASLPVDWPSFRAESRNASLMQFIEIRNAYCHSNSASPQIQKEVLLELYENRLYDLILQASRFLIAVGILDSN